MRSVESRRNPILAPPSTGDPRRVVVRVNVLTGEAVAVAEGVAESEALLEVVFAESEAEAEEGLEVAAVKGLATMVSGIAEVAGMAEKLASKSSEGITDSLGMEWKV